MMCIAFIVIDGFILYEGVSAVQLFIRWEGYCCWCECLCTRPNLTIQTTPTLMSVCRSSLYSASHLTPKWIDLRYRMKRKGSCCASVDLLLSASPLHLSFLPSFLPSVMPRSLPVYPTQITSMNIDFPSVSYLSVSLMCLGISLPFPSWRIETRSESLVSATVFFICAVVIHLTESLSVVEGVRRRKYDCVSCVTDWEGSI